MADPVAAGGGADARELAAALRRVGIGEVDGSVRRRAEYSSDASLYRVPPAVVVFPRDAGEVIAALEVCRALGVPFTARGAGTSIAGNAVGPGVVADLSRHLRRIGAIDPEAQTAQVEPGVVLDSLQAAVRPHGLRFGPDPSTHSRCTLGGMIGNNSCGARALAYGRTADNVVALDVLSGNGARFAARQGRGRGSDPVGSAPAGAAAAALAALRQLVDANLALLRTEFGRFGRQVSGYSLEHLLPEHGFDVAKALVGTEGTLGVVLGATLRLVRVPAATALVVLGYPDLAAAADAVPALLPVYHRDVAAAAEGVGAGASLGAVEGLDARIFEVVRRRRGGAAVPPLPSGAGLLLVELGAATPEDAAVAARRLLADAAAPDSRMVTDPAQAAALWRLREDGAGLAGRTLAGAPGYAGWEDAAVPPDQLGAYLREFNALLAQYGLDGLPYGHFGDGCIHIRIDFPLDRPGGRAGFRSFVEDAARLVAAHGGSLSGEHGDGRARSALLSAMYSGPALQLMAAVKAVFDPQNLLNPGVVVDPRPFDADLRRPAARPLHRVSGRLGFTDAYAEDGGDFAAAVHRCTGVGKCLADTTGSGGVMCPSYLATRDEKDTTRGRAHVLQEAANGTLVAGWRAKEVRESLDLCLACKGCASDCPTGVDMATYKAEVLHQTYHRRLRPASHYSLGWLPRWARLAARAPRASNWLLARQPLASLAKRAGGIDPHRALPRFAKQTFRSWFRDQAQAPAPADGDGRPAVLLWVDTFTDHFAPQVGIAAVKVLQDAGYAVRIPDPERGLCCALTWISTGQLPAARRLLRRTVDTLAPLLADGIPLVGLEPSCTAVLRADARMLLGSDDPAASAVAAATTTLAELLGQRSPAWIPPDLHGVRAVAQPHCHHRAVLGWDADRDLLARAGAEVREVGGCCGLAGNFGFERGHYHVSVAVANTALLPAVHTAEDGREGAVVLADGFSCRLQLDQLAQRKALHLAELLAKAAR